MQPQIIHDFSWPDAVLTHSSSMHQPSLLHQQPCHKPQHPSHSTVLFPSTSGQSWAHMPGWMRGLSTKASSPVSALSSALPPGSYPLSPRHPDSLVLMAMTKSNTVGHPDAQAQRRHMRPRTSNSTATMCSLVLYPHLPSSSLSSKLLLS
ncbi:hypothetical protein CUC08_Gglean001564 [Alternaria sp. MG1]|nr:hypothetical protein CUC08_Gglean001564 [Alternaria sp. MG1]